MELSVAIFLLPLFVGIIVYFADLKKNGKLTFFGGLVILMSAAYFILGTKDIADKSTKSDKYESTIDSLNAKSDSIKVKADAYYEFLKNSRL
jgi:hypothetical protein